MKKLTQVEFIEKCNIVHKNKYDYSKSVYTKGTENIIIICPIHGEFITTASSHLMGSGCKSCGLVSRSNIRSNGVDGFIKKARDIHGDKYDYKDVVYSNNKTKVDIICPTHGKFSMRPDCHIGLKQGCKQCGIDRSSAAQTKHGLAHHPMYGTWKMMMQRCYNPEHREYIRYGAKGVVVCDDFKTPPKFIAYVETLDGYNFKDRANLTLDRIDVNGNYEYGNLRFATKLEQACNKRMKAKGYYGVNFVDGKWRSSITVGNKRIFQCYYQTEKEALEARNSYIKQHNLPHQIQEYSPPTQ